jgi:tellurite resistance protein
MDSNNINVYFYKYSFTTSGLKISGTSSHTIISLLPKAYSIQLCAGGPRYKASISLNKTRVPIQSSLSESTEQKLIAELNTKAQRPNYWTWGVAGLIISALIFGLGLITFLSFVLVLLLAVIDHIAKTTVLHYSFDEKNLLSFNYFNAALATISQSKGLWQVNSTDPTDRLVITCSNHLPINIKSNISFPTLKIGNLTIYFTPDCILMQSNKTFTSVDYAKQEISEHEIDFIERAQPHSDAKVVSHTWKYTKISGEPDKRYKDNPRYPVMRYTLIQFKSATGLNQTIMSSAHFSKKILTQALTLHKATISSSTVEVPTVQISSTPHTKLSENQLVEKTITAVNSENDLRTFQLQPTDSSTKSIDTLPSLNQLPPAHPSTNLVEENFATFQLQPENSGLERKIPLPSPMQKLPPKGTNIWIPFCEPVEVSGIVIPNGGIYVGTQSANRPIDEPSIIDPNLPVSNHYVSQQERLMGYWPSYNQISSEARRAYLEWQAGGRSNPAADVGYVFLFFYGLEKRALVDINTDVNAKKDIGNIVAEVQRLLTIYGNSGSFRGYATRFINFITFDPLAEKIYISSPVIPTELSYELPFSYRVALGQLAVDKQPLPADWALAWTLSDNRISKRTPVTRCADIFASLFKANYLKKYPKGFILAINRTKLEFGYNAAAANINYKTKNLVELPDVTAISGPVNKLQSIVDITTEQLDAYSRHLGRNPEDAQRTEGLLLLPFEIWPEETKTLFNNLQEQIAQEAIVLDFSTFLENINIKANPSRVQIIQLVQSLEKLGIGFEPDLLAGAKLPKPNDAIALFKTQAEDVNLRLAPSYHAAFITMELASAVAMADGQVSEAELHLLHRQVESWVHLTPLQHHRLKASLQLKIKQPDTLSSLKKKLEPLSIESKQSIARLLAHLAQADGNVGHEEVKLLEKIYSALGLDEQQVYRDLHTTSVNSTIKGTSTTPSGSSVKTASFELNIERIAMLQKETALVSSLLSDVFVDETMPIEPTPALEPQTLESSPTTLLNLDQEHTTFLRHLISRPQWSRDDLLNLAADLELMLDGALENINEASLDHWDEQLIEGDDPLEINQNLIEKLAT